MKIKFLWVAIAYIIFGVNLISAVSNLPSPLLPEKNNQIRLVAAGDLVMHLPVVNSVRQTDGTYDFRPVFAGIKPEITEADLAVCVLESPLNAPQSKYSGYPRFNSPASIADALKWAGFDLVFTANNHSLDQGFAGVESTVGYLDRIELLHTGTRKNPTKPRYLLVTKNGVKLAFLSFTTTTNGILPEKGREWSVNLLKLSEISAEIESARKAGADGIVFALHTGIEYQRFPSSEQQELVEQLLSLGVDIILGSHVHVIQPIESKILASTVVGYNRTVFVAYSLGNFLSNQRWRYSDCGLMVNLKIIKQPQTRGIRITEAGYDPIWVNVFYENNRPQYRIIKLTGPQSLETGLNQVDRQRIKEVWDDTTTLMKAWVDQQSVKQTTVFKTVGVK